MACIRGLIQQLVSAGYRHSLALRRSSGTFGENEVSTGKCGRRPMSETHWITLHTDLAPTEVAARLQATRLGPLLIAWPRFAGRPFVVSVTPDSFAIRMAGYWKTYGIQGTVTGVEVGTHIVLEVEPIQIYGRVHAIAALLMVAAMVPALSIWLPLWQSFRVLPSPPVGLAIAAAALVLACVLLALTQPTFPKSDLRRSRRDYVNSSEQRMSPLKRQGSPPSADQDLKHLERTRAWWHHGSAPSAQAWLAADER
jgi:hypothetical protein